ncbi:MAG: single-stranded DNA-binding protein [Pontimonas sp.]|jgi:single-strand DNA-binding protein
MIDTLSVSGIVATTPRHIVTSEGLAITSFRLASTQRRFDKGQAQWVDIDTNWYTVVAFRQLALNAHTSLNKGDRVVATGRVKVRNWESEDKSGTAIEIEADALGHDLLWGTSSFERNSLARDLESASESDADPF